METRKRSLIKSVSWRLFALMLTFVATWVVTGSIRTGMAVGLVDFVTKLVTFYLHERLWQRVRWGQMLAGQVSDGGGI